MVKRHLLVALLTVASSWPVAATEQTIEGPIPATVLRVVDGDTIAVRASIWLGQEVETMVRVAGVDTPELRGKCQREKDLARQARQFVETLVGEKVRLHDITHDKYGFRVLARVEAPQGSDLAAALISEGLGRPYGGKQRDGWCGPE